MMERTCGRMAGEVMSTGNSPIWAARSNEDCTAPMNCCSLLGAMARADMLGNGLNGATVTGDFGHGLKDRGQVADGNAFRKQRLEDALQA